MLLSDFPETFSYTLDELLALAVPTLATRIGAFADRIRDGQNGFLVDNAPRAVIEMLENLDKNRDPLVSVRRALESTTMRTEEHMIRDYDALLSLPRYSPRAIEARG